MTNRSRGISLSPGASRRIAGVVLAGACVAVPFACSATAGNSLFGVGGAGGDNPSGTPTGSGTPSATDGAGGSLFAGAGGTGSGGSCGVHCSPDLHDVLDCNETVVKSCPATEGCAAGACVAPCDAAKANASTLGCDFYAVVPGPEYE